MTIIVLGFIRVKTILVLNQVGRMFLWSPLVTDFPSIYFFEEIGFTVEVVLCFLSGTVVTECNGYIYKHIHVYVLHNSADAPTIKLPDSGKRTHVSNL